MIRFILLALLATLSVPSIADTTIGGVSWADTLGYTKPQFYSITVPNEASAAHKWYVDLGAGSGTTCSSASPCAWTGLSGKAGINDGTGAYVYIKGSGSMGGTGSDFSIVGASGAEVVVKPWNDSTTATITGRNNWTQNKKYLIFDGGPNAQIRFSMVSGGQFDPSVYFSAGSGAQQNITFARTRWNVSTSGMQVASWGYVTNLSFINSEFSATGWSGNNNNQHHIYISECGVTTGAGATMDGLVMRNNIFRDTPGEAIEFRMAASTSVLRNAYIEGNAFHNVGLGTCGAGWKCRSAITFSTDNSGCGTSGGSFQDTIRVGNNLIWNTGSNCIYTSDNQSTAQFYGNTCFNWGMGSPANGAYGSAAFANYAFTNPPGIFTNNVLWAAGSDANGNDKQPYPPSATTSNKSFNACETGETCGTSSQVVSAASFQSLVETDIDFLKITSGASPIDHGSSTPCISPDYFGTSARSPCDIGAYEYVVAGGDTTPPTVSMTAPSNGATIRGTSVTVSANASDDTGVVGVQFKRDGSTNIGAEDTTSPYSVFFDSTTVADGSHTLTATARDAAGNSATATAVTVTVDNTAPTASITAPGSGAIVRGASVTLSASVSDVSGVAGVQFKIDGASVGAEDTTAPYSIVWDSIGATNAAHTITATVRDVPGNSATTAGVSITVDNSAPTVSITAPSNGSTVSGSAVAVNASASDNVGVVGVRFQLDGANLGNEDTTSPYGILWNSTGASDGSHTLTATARDAAGNSTNSSAVTVTVDNSPPVLSGVGPSGMQALGTTSINLAATTNEASSCRYAVSSGVAYGSKSAMSSTGGTSHSQSISVIPGRIGHPCIACMDSSGHVSADSCTSFWVQTTKKNRKH